MSSGKKAITDLLFGIQIVGASVFCGAQLLRTFVDVRGVSVAQLGTVVAFLIFHLVLGIDAHRTLPSRLTRQAIATYCVWLVWIVLIVLSLTFGGRYLWSVQDTTTSLMALALTFVVLVFGKILGRPLIDPSTKAMLAIVYKAVPQALLAWKILSEGGSGIPCISILVGHITILIRLGQIGFMIKEAGWDRNRLWLAISEGANEVSWVIATLAWLIRLN